MNEVNVSAKTMSGLRAAVRKLAIKIAAPKGALPTFGTSRDFGYPYVEVDGRGLHWVVRERGIELERKTTDDPKELLYWVFESVTSSMASEYELSNRVAGQDSRRLLFSRQLELLEQLDAEWGAITRLKLESILKEHPYDDRRSA